MSEFTKHLKPARSALVQQLSDEQIEALAEFYQSWTNKDARTILMAPEAAPADPDYLSPMVPKGYDTVLGFLARHLPHVLELMEGYAEASQRDGWWLMHRAKSRGIATVRVQACRWLIQQGIFEVNAYPVSLLAERFPVDG